MKIYKATATLGHSTRYNPLILLPSLSAFLSVETWERLEKPAGSFAAPTALSCGLKCSMMEAWCGMFHYDKNNKICTPAKVKFDDIHLFLKLLEFS